MKIWVIILNWESPLDTLRCVGSFLDNGFCKQRIVIVDNCSSDNSIEQIKKYYPDVKLIVAGMNRGYAGGNNLGIQYALDQGAEYTLVVNNDTVLKNPNFLKQAEKLMKTENKIAIIGATVYFPDGRIQPTILRYPTFWNTIKNTFDRILKRKSVDYCRGQYVDAVSGVCFFGRASFFKEVGLIDESFFMYGEEQDLCWRAKKAKWKIWYEPMESVIHYHMAGDLTPERRVRKYFYSRRNRVIFCWKNNMFFQSILMAAILIISFILKTFGSIITGKYPFYAKVWRHCFDKSCWQ